MSHTPRTLLPIGSKAEMTKEINQIYNVLRNLDVRLWMDCLAGVILSLIPNGDEITKATQKHFMEDLSERVAALSDEQLSS